jgi:hypothetical protein
VFTGVNSGGPKGVYEAERDRSKGLVRVFGFPTFSATVPLKKLN